MATESSDKFSFKSSRIKVTGEVLKYDAGLGGKVGTFILSQKLDEKFTYFEIKILDVGVSGCISVGLAPYDYPNDAQPGWRFASVGFHADDGRLFQNPPVLASQGRQVSQPCCVGDRMGCGIRKLNGVPNMQPGVLFGGPQCSLEVYFTVNGAEIGSTIMEVPDSVDGLHPVVGMHSHGETAQLTVIPGLAPTIDASMDDFMAVDDTEEEWVKIHDVKVNGQIIEYTGNGANIHDVGLAQGKHPLTTRRHYFEIEIVEPGASCYIAIGLIHKNYPLHRHPGWNTGSIAYHADDGKIFLGRGQGVPFGPKCSRGDVMGCGIQFPVDYVTPASATSDDDDDDDDAADYVDDDDAGRLDDAADYRIHMPIFNNLVMDEPGLDIDDELIESGDEEDFLWPPPDKINDAPWMPFDIDIAFEDPVRHVMFPEGRMLGRGRGLRHGFRSQYPSIYGTKEKALNVKVFFTRNGYMVGHKEVLMPKEGFYPAVGMLSSREKVKVDLHPLTG